MKRILLGLVALIVNASLFAQTYPPAGLENEALRTWLKQNWYDSKHSSLGYSGARTAMYSYIDEASDGEVYCVYTGFHQPSESTSFLDPINAEHTVPQSWFSSANPMRSDIHHLFPTHKDVNNARGSLPFAEINDSSTDTWYTVNSTNSGLTTTSSTPSASVIDNYSERKTNDDFEVKEDHKGNTARAIFYFYTMYPTQAGSISQIGDINELYQWHLDDPVDTWEEQRNVRTEERQGNRNPYIDHPELVAKAWGFAAASPSVSFAATSGSITEGNSGSQTYQVTVAASSAPSGNVTFDIGVDGSSTATSGVDYTLSTTSVTLTNANFSQTVSVTVNGDTDFESDESVILKIQNLSGDATLGTDTHTLTINNDDSPPAISFASSSGSQDEGNSGTSSYDVTVNISPAPSATVTVDVSIDGGSASSGSDYTLTTTSLSFNASTTSLPVTLTINGDTDVESDETVNLMLENVSGGSAVLGSTTSHTLTINNDDVACVAPTSLASNLQASSVNSNSAQLSWTAGDGTNRLVLAKSGSDFTANDLPVNGSSYTASTTFGNGSAIGDAFVIMNGSANSTSLLGLTSSTSYFFAVVEYDCDPLEYLTSGVTAISFTTEQSVATSTTISFTTASSTIASEGQAEVTLDLGEPLVDVSEVELIITTTNNIANGTAFSTTPSSTSGTLTLNIPAQTSQATFTLNSLNDESGDVVFTILNLSNNLSVGTINSFTATIDPPTGLEDDLAAVGVSIFPNPAKEGVFIQQDNYNGDRFVVGLYSLSGKAIDKRVKQTAHAFYQFPKVQEGMYLLYLELDGKGYFKRIVIGE